MNEATRKSLRAIVDYQYPDEEKHWQEEGRPVRHIFCDILRVASWLDTIAN